MKMIYYVHQNPSLASRDRFLAKWRQHGVLGMSDASWDRDMHQYIQAEPISPAAVPGFEPERDAIAVVVRADIEDLEAMQAEIAADPALREYGEMMATDELATFDGYVHPHTLVVDEEIIRAGEPGGVTAYLFFVDAASAQTQARSLTSVPGATRIVLDTKIPESGPTLPYSAVIELSAPTLQALCDAVQGPARSAVDAADHAVMARESVIWDRISSSSIR